MKRNFSLLFFLKKGKTDPQGISSIYMRITIEKKRAEIATGKVCQDSDWENGKIKGNTAQAKALNTYLHQMELKVHNSHRQLLMSDENITAETVMNEFLGKSIKVKMLTEVFEMHNKEMKEFLGSCTRFLFTLY